jgi:hypothetical protein
VYSPSNQPKRVGEIEKGKKEENQEHSADKRQIAFTWASCLLFKVKGKVTTHLRHPL